MTSPNESLIEEASVETYFANPWLKGPLIKTVKLYLTPLYELPHHFEVSGAAKLGIFHGFPGIASGYHGGNNANPSKNWNSLSSLSTTFT